jgi:hypothetical protein
MSTRADEATMDLLRFAGRRLREARVLLVVTFRDDDLAADDQLRVALGELARQRSTRRISLTALSAGAVRELASGSDLKAATLYQLTGGNPFYVTEVLQAGMAAVPASARDAVLARAAGLSADARQLLEVAALTGARVEAALLEATAGCPAQAVDELLTCGLLAADGGWLRFRHEIARLAVEQAIPARRRAAIHGQILTALRSSGARDEAQMAFHAEEADDVAAVLRYAPAAARARRPVDPGRPKVRDPGGSARPHPARRGGPRGDLRRAEQRRDRRQAVHLGQDRRPPCLRRARQARRAEPQRRRGAGRQARPALVRQRAGLPAESSAARFLPIHCPGCPGVAENIRTSKWRKIPCQSPEFPLAAGPRLAPGHQRGAVVHGLGAGVVNLAAAMTYTLLVLLTALLAKGDAGAGKG